MKMRLSVAVGVLALVIAGCGTAQDDSGTDEAAQDSTTTTSAPDVTSPPSDETLTTTHPNGDVQFAISDLAKRVGKDQSEIAVVSVEEVEWPDTSVGCPDPNKAYAQMIVNGYDIVLQVDGREYHYHGAGGEDPFYCAIPTS